MDKLNIANEMAQVDSKNRSFYDELTDEERKKFSTYLMIRWSSAVSGSRELQEYYIQSCNHYLNRDFFTVNRHPKLQWLMATAVSPDLGQFRHHWIAPKKKEKTKNDTKRQLQDLFPAMKQQDLEVLSAINSSADIQAILREHGN